jgi:nucleotidyltransferase/DNA polymerase involved in DNA repair
MRAEVQRLVQARRNWIEQLRAWEETLARSSATQPNRTDEVASLATLAAGFLRRITAHSWRHVHITGVHAVTVEDESGRVTNYADLDGGARDQVYLACCMAIVVAGEQRGCHLPLVLNAVFTDYPSRSVREALETLRDFGEGRQVLCFTRHEHVVSVARQLNVPVRSLVEGMVADSRHHAGDRVPAPVREVAPNDVPDYLLHEHDPIDRAPSIDEANAARLRRVGVARVGDLLRVNAADVVAELQSYGVTHEMIETWRSQALLMCRLRGLRPYDARILVACGVRDPQQLVHLQPGALRARVKEFAASAQGQATIMSGTEYELSRLSDWIGAAREATAEHAAQAAAGGASRRSDSRSASRSRRRAVLEEARRQRQSASEAHRDPPETNPHAGEHDSVAQIVPLGTAAGGWRFYLQRTDSIADAPSIGSGLAKRLEAIGIRTVDDLLKADGAHTAARLGSRRIDADTVRRWQQQSQLVCRIPRLRGHDAQFLVAAGVHTVEQLVEADPATLYRQIRGVLSTSDGKRMLRGGKEPERAEVAEWIESARHARTLLAA